MLASPPTVTWTVTPRAGWQLKCGTDTVSDVGVAAVTLAAAPSMVTSLFAAVELKPVPIRVADPPNTIGVGDMAVSVTTPVVTVAPKDTGEPTSPVTDACTVLTAALPGVQMADVWPSVPVVPVEGETVPPPEVTVHVTSTWLVGLPN